jgi:hypothetical protein
MSSIFHCCFSCLICIIGKNRLKEKFQRKPGIYVKLLLAM